MENTLLYKDRLRKAEDVDDLKDFSFFSKMKRCPSLSYLTRQAACSVFEKTAREEPSSAKMLIAGISGTTKMAVAFRSTNLPANKPVMT